MMEGETKKEGEGEETRTYKENKKLAEEFCPKILDHNVSLSLWKDVVTQFKKQDDMFDSALQMIWYLHNKNYVKFQNFEIIVASNNCCIK